MRNLVMRLRNARRPAMHFQSIVSAILAALATTYSIAAASVAAETAPADTPPPLTAIAETVRVRFQGFKDLDGVYRLNEDETVSVPGVGRLSITGLTAAQLETALARRIMGSTGRLAPVSVEVESYRHVFVTGHVEKPASFQWQRGMTVVKAESLAGGIYRPRPSLSASDNSVIARGRADIARITLAQAIATLARIAAELDGAAKPEASERLAGLLGRSGADRLLSAEQTVLDKRHEALAAQLALIAAQEASAKTEIARLETLTSGMSGRLQSYATLLKNLRRTHRSGDISNQRLFEVEQRLAELEEKIATANVSIARARGAAQTLETKRVELTQTRREKLIEEQIKTKAAVDKAEIEYDVALASIRHRTGEPRSNGSDTPGASAGNASPTTISAYEIIRRTSGGDRRIAASATDPLQPGDTLIVRPAASAEKANGPALPPATPPAPARNARERS